MLISEETARQLETGSEQAFYPAFRLPERKEWVHILNVFEMCRKRFLPFRDAYSS